MGQTQLILVVTLILMSAFSLGWGAHWIFRKMNRVDSSNIAELDHLATQLHEAEETRAEAIAYMQSREQELTTQLSQAEAELSAAMEGLGVSRRESEELRAYIDEHLSG